MRLVITSPVYPQTNIKYHVAAPMDSPSADELSDTLTGRMDMTWSLTNYDEQQSVIGSYTLEMVCRVSQSIATAL